MILEEYIKKQNECSHLKIRKCNSEIVEYYYECINCGKISSSSNYFKHYNEEVKK
tara:strand:+ start:1135 stop:1299 length:165 start_codon:yes stop_codon:yes gene_type:complete